MEGIMGGGGQHFLALGSRGARLRPLLPSSLVESVLSQYCLGAAFASLRRALFDPALLRHWDGLTLARGIESEQPFGTSVANRDLFALPKGKFSRCNESVEEKCTARAVPIPKRAGK